MDDTAALIQRLYDEASQCELFGITKPAALLREAAEALQHAASETPPEIEAVYDVFGKLWPAS